MKRYVKSNSLTDEIEYEVFTNNGTSSYPKIRTSKEAIPYITKIAKLVDKNYLNTKTDTDLPEYERHRNAVYDALDIFYNIYGMRCNLTNKEYLEIVNSI